MEKDYKETGRNLCGGDGHVHYLDCEDGVMDAHMFENLANCTIHICIVYFMSVVPLIKLLKKKYLLTQKKRL